MIKKIFTLLAFTFLTPVIASDDGEKLNTHTQRIFSGVTKISINNICGNIFFDVREDPDQKVIIKAEGNIQDFFKGNYFKEDYSFKMRKNVLVIKSKDLRRETEILSSIRLRDRRGLENNELMPLFKITAPKKCKLSIVSAYMVHIKQLNAYLNAHIYGMEAELKVDQLKAGGSIILSGGSTCCVKDVSGKSFQSHIFGDNDISIKNINVDTAYFSMNTRNYDEEEKLTSLIRTMNIKQGNVRNLNVNICHYPTEKRIELLEFCFLGQAKYANLTCYGKGSIHINKVEKRVRKNCLIGGKVTIDNKPSYKSSKKHQDATTQ
ncbi:MAG: hypothetical protein ACRYGR_00250 [Janthinobacterium lividum]